MRTYTAADGYECEECKRTDVATVTLLDHGSAYDDARWFCADCLRAALALLSPPRTHARTRWDDPAERPES